jgi:hypothetical protein
MGREYQDTQIGLVGSLRGYVIGDCGCSRSRFDLSSLAEYRSRRPFLVSCSLPGPALADGFQL